jgi:hypothetical protein
MDYATFNGIPLTTYGLIGVTTMLLTYSVFRDDSNEKEPEKLPTQESESTKTGFFTSPLGLLTAKPTETADSDVKSIMESTTEGVKSITESVKEEVGSLTDSLQKKDESPPVKAVGGKRKRTKRRRDKNKKTKNNRK